MALFKNFIRQPLVHFLLIGAAIFAFYAALNEPETTTSVEEIVVTEEKGTQLAAGFEAVWRRPPNGEELKALVDDYVREEVLAREAVALSLDRDDAVIRRRLRQKMEFLTESAAEALKPSDEELRDYFDADPQRYASNTRIAFEQVFAGLDPNADEIERARQSLEAGGDPADIGARTLLPASLPLSVQSAVDGTFGNGFFQGLSEATVGEWSGPVRSGYGAHLVRVTDRSDAAVPPFDEVRAAVLRDWADEKAEEIAEAQYTRMLARYTVTRPDLSTIEVKPQ